MVLFLCLLRFKLTDKIKAIENYGQSYSVKGVQEKRLWDIVSQISNDIMTINERELLRRVSSLFDGLIS